MTQSAYILKREDLDCTFYALMSDAEPTRLLSSMMLPAGAEIDAVEKMLLSAAGSGFTGTISTTLRGNPSVFDRAASRCAEAFGVPVRILDIAQDAGRIARAEPGVAGVLTVVAGAAMIPADATERRRRCDAVLQLLGERDRAAVADRLGDIADRPMAGRDEIGDQIRAAAYIDAIQSVADLTIDVPTPISGEVLVVTGRLAALLATGIVPLGALAPVVTPGRTSIVLEVAGVLAALGTEQLTDDTGAELVKATADQLFVAAGDVFVITDGAGDQVVVRARSQEYVLGDDDLLELVIQPGESVAVEVEITGHTARVLLRGGLAGAAVVRGLPLAVLGGAMEVVRHATVLPIDAPLALLPRAASAVGGLGGRLLLGDEVEGRLYYSPSEPDSRGWAAAHTAGILAVVSVSPETVLRARAVGIRGLVVGSLSDGEREALSASIDRRVAAGVALAPFGLLVLGGRRESDEWAAQLGTALERLHGSEVRLERYPAGLTTKVGQSAARPIGVDTVVIGGPRAGSYGTWRGLSDAQPSDPHGAVEINGELFALPLGDLQRLTA